MRVVICNFVWADDQHRAQTAEHTPPRKHPRHEFIPLRSTAHANVRENARKRLLPNDNDNDNDDDDDGSKLATKIRHVRPESEQNK